MNNTEYPFTVAQYLLADGHYDADDLSWMDLVNADNRDETVRPIMRVSKPGCDRFVWADGSAIVVKDGKWDFGIHQALLQEPMIVEATSNEAKFAWPTQIDGLSAFHAHMHIHSF